MSELYNRINHLCKERGTNITALCRDAKVARSVMSELNMGRTKTITLETASKLADALKITVDELMGTGQKQLTPTLTEKDERDITFDDFTYAMQNEYKDLSDNDKEILLSLAKQLKNAKRARDGKIE